MKRLILLTVVIMLLNLNNLSAKQDNIKNGVEKTYYPNGVLWLELTYKNGKLEGIQKSYFENGNIQTEDEYKNDKRNGQYKGYSSNGNLYVEYTFIDDKKNGPFALYYKSGKLKEKGTYKDDVVHGKVSFFDENHITFPTKTHHNFVECHHIIPLSLSDSFSENLDCINNIIPLCPNCHKAIHLSNSAFKEPLISRIYNESELTNSFTNITFDDLKEIYIL